MANNEYSDPPEDIISSDIFGNCTSNYLTEDMLDSFLCSENRSLMNIIHINCRSLCKNFNSIVNLLNRTNSKIDAMGLTETWLTPNSPDNLNIDGYNFICRSRIDKIGGGVGMFIGKEYVYQIRSDLSYIKDFIETIFVEIFQKNSAGIIIGCIYRPPNSDVSLFNCEILSILNILNMNRKKISFIMGDFNLDLLHYDLHAPASDFVNNLISHFFLPTIHKPTRITETSATLLDNILTNNYRYNMDTAILYSDISDHLPVVMRVNLSLSRNELDKICVKRVYSDVQVSSFKCALSFVDWNDVCINSANCVNPTEPYNLFFNTFLKIFDDHFPQKNLKLSRTKTPRKDWITKGLVKSCNKKSILYKKYIVNPTSENKSKYIKYRKN